MSEPIISLSGVCKNFKVGSETVHGLRSVSLDIHPGEYMAIMGPSGSGKSTLLHMIGLLDRPDEGRYLLEGRDVTELSDAECAAVRRRRIGFIFQFFHLVPRLTAAQNVELPMLLASISPRERSERVREILDRVGLSARARHRPDQLSGGQRQRVAIARATVMQPAVLLADEPTGNLDKAAGNEVVAILEQLNQDGLTLIMVTHDPAVGKRAHRQTMMDDGAVANGGE